MKVKTALRNKNATTLETPMVERRGFMDGARDWLVDRDASAGGDVWAEECGVWIRLDLGAGQ